MLIHDRDREPPPEDSRRPPPWEPNWRLWAWVLAAAIVAIAAVNASGAVSTLLVLTAFGLCCRAVNEALPYGAGLTDWHQ